MPVTKQARKKLRKDKRREEKNLKIKVGYKKTVKKTRSNPNTKNLTEASKVLDKAAKKGVMHKNKAARIKSRLAKASKSTKSSPSKAK